MTAAAATRWIREHASVLSLAIALAVVVLGAFWALAGIVGERSLRDAVEEAEETMRALDGTVSDQSKELGEVIAALMASVVELDGGLVEVKESLDGGLVEVKESLDGGLVEVKESMEGLTDELGGEVTTMTFQGSVERSAVRWHMNRLETTLTSLSTDVESVLTRMGDLSGALSDCQTELSALKLQLALDNGLPIDASNPPSRRVDIPFPEACDTAIGLSLDLAR